MRTLRDPGSLRASFFLLLLLVSATMLRALSQEGYIVEPYTVTCQQPSCTLMHVPIARVLERCGDDDGCTMRMIRTLDGTTYSGTAVHEFTINADGVLWTVTGETIESHSNGDGIADLVFAIDGGSSGGCLFLDDELDNTELDFELRIIAAIFGQTSCTLRIDD